MQIFNDDEIFTIINCGIKYKMPWKYLKRCELFESLRLENKIERPIILFTSPISFPYVLSYLINPNTIIPYEYYQDVAYFGITLNYKKPEIDDIKEYINETRKKN